MTDYNIIIIGAGPGGYVAAIKAAQLGFTVACIDKIDTLGGTCLNVGCIPSKTLLEISHNYYEAKNEFNEYGIIADNVSFNLEKILANKDNIIKKLTDGIKGLFKKNKVQHIVGNATIIAPGVVKVSNDNGESQITADNIIIATGSSVTPFPGVTIDEEKIISSTGALKLKKVPKKMIVIGGGVIGLELGSVWSRLGADVTVVEFLDSICPMADKEIIRNFQKTLTAQGIKFKTGHKVEKIEIQGDKVLVNITNKKTNETISEIVDVVLVAIGRKPNTSSLGCEELGIVRDKRGFISVDENFKTSIDKIYAIGDVINGPMLAHKAEEDGIACVEKLAGSKVHVDYNLIPSVIYTYPEVAFVGKTEEELKESGIPYSVGKFFFAANSRAKATFSEQGFVKILTCKKTDRILGGHIIGREAGNLIHEIVIIMEFCGSGEDLARICHAHPSFNEAVKEAAMAAYDKAIHS